MPSFSCVNFTDGSGSPGELKMHDHAHLINGVLRGTPLALVSNVYYL